MKLEGKLLNFFSYSREENRLIWRVVAYLAIIMAIVGNFSFSYYLYQNNLLNSTRFISILILLISLLVLPVLYLFHLGLKDLFSFAFAILPFAFVVIIVADSGGGLASTLYITAAMNFAFMAKNMDDNDKRIQNNNRHEL